MSASRKLWDLSVEFRQIGEDEDTPLDVRLQILEGIGGSIREKLINCLRYQRNREASREGIKAEIDRLKAMADRETREIDGLKAYMHRCMEAAKIERVDLDDPIGRYIAIRRNPARVVPNGRAEWDNLALDALPQGYVRVKREPELQAIAAAIRNGEPVPGARMQNDDERTHRIEIR